MRLLTTGEVCEVAKLAPTTLADWMEQGIIKPVVKGGKGRGNVCRFSVMQAFALYAGVRWRDEGAGMERTRALVQFLSVVPLEHWEGEFDAGRTMPVLPYQFGDLELKMGTQMFIEPPSDAPADLMKRVELGGLWKQLTAEIVKLDKASAKTKAKRKQTV